MAVDALLLPRAVGRRDVCSSGIAPTGISAKASLPTAWAGAVQLQLSSGPDAGTDF